MRIALEKMRSSVEQTSAGLRIVIPSRANWFVVLFLCIWLCGWAFGEFFAAWALFGISSAKSPQQGPPNLLLLFWLVAWTFGGAAVVYGLVWNAVGREIVTLDGATLSLRREPLPFPARKEFDWSAVGNLRVSPVGFSRYDWFQPPSSGVVAFDYSARTFRFGVGLDEAEGEMLVDAIAARFQLRGTR